jgi:hypothetical protein
MWMHYHSDHLFIHPHLLNSMLYMFVPPGCCDEPERVASIASASASVFVFVHLAYCTRESVGAEFGDLVK